MRLARCEVDVPRRCLLNGLRTDLAHVARKAECSVISSTGEDSGSEGAGSSDEGFSEERSPQSTGTFPCTYYSRLRSSCLLMTKTV